jgi:glycosyltransferase involved in cell wall biosynthesis
MNIMFASHTYMGGPFVVGSHHLAREFGKLGHSVIHVSTPLSPFHLLKFNNKDIRERFRISAGKRKGEAGAPINSVPISMLPWEIAGSIYKRTGKNWMLPSMKRILRRNKLTEIDLLLIDQPSFVGLEKLVGAKMTIYRPTDLYSKLTGNSSIAAAEEALLSNVDGLVSTSGPVLSELLAYNPSIPTLLLENGVEFDHFAKETVMPEEYKSIPGPRAIYVGALDDRLDTEAMHLLAEQLPELSIVVIGPSNRSAEDLFFDCPNVYLLGAKDYSTIPSYLQYADVALLPLSKHSANQGRSPMKLYEYAAAGLTVVVTETDELLRRKEDFLFFYKETSEFPSAVRKALSQKSDKEQVRELARKHAWNSKVQTLIEFVNNL